jgi:DNA repair exonuclease SbcCD ATPase subunit
MVALNHHYSEQISSLKQELDRTRKRHLEQISSLATENDFQKAIAKRQRTEAETSIKKLQAETKKLKDTIENMRNIENESQQRILSLVNEKATLQRDPKEAYDDGVRMGMEQFVKTKSITTYLAMLMRNPYPGFGFTDGCKLATIYLKHTS